jgi:NAD(P)-dependent dehydrogenase (short-subunit alcohol dehydrogenase family)
MTHPALAPNHVAVITGGASGIGLAAARKFLALGMKVAIADYRQDALDAAATELGPDVLAVRTNVASRDDIERLKDAVYQRFGKVNVLMNNAGTDGAGPVLGSFENWERVIGTNLFGAVNGVRVFLPLLEANDEGGHILNTVSTSGLFTTRAQAAYAASKAALLSLSETLAMELEAEGGKVGVTALCPGPVDTNIRTSGRNRAGEYGDTGRTEGQPDIHERAFRAASPPEAFADARTVADIGFDAMLAGAFWAITHPELMAAYQARHAVIQRTIGAGQ